MMKRFQDIKEVFYFCQNMNNSFHFSRSNFKNRKSCLAYLKTKKNCSRLLNGKFDTW